MREAHGDTDQLLVGTAGTAPAAGLSSGGEGSGTAGGGKLHEG